MTELDRAAATAVPTTAEAFSAAVLDWYAGAARDLPWRGGGVTPWGVLVSEVMLQQTPAARVAPVWSQWMERWPAPAALAGEPAGEAVRAWGRLGYPRRALRLHATAVALLDRHDGDVPSSYDALLALPGVGSYTAAAVAAFGFGQRHAVLDTNVRRVHARVLDGVADAPTASPSVGERAAALDLVPHDQPARHSVAVMELGALVCVARAPRCDVCPVASTCAWLARGRPAGSSARRVQSWAGSDRQVRGRLLAAVRDADGEVALQTLAAEWDDDAQRDRALASLLADGLLVRRGETAVELPS